jgi:CysZ protein
LALTAPFTGLRWVFTDVRALGLALSMGTLSGGLLIGLLAVSFFVNTPLTDYITDRTGFWYALIWIGVFLAQIPLVLATHRGLASLVTSRLQEALSAHVDGCIEPQRVFPGRDSSVLSSLAEFLLGLPKALAVSLVILAVNFIPIAGQILAIALAIVLSAKALARDLVALPMERRGLSDEAIDAEIRERRILWYASGAVFTLLSLVPFLNLLAIPAGIAAATSRYVDVEQAAAPDVLPLATETNKLTQ